VQGGFSIIAVQDTRKILTADPRNAVLSLKQVSVTFRRAPPGHRRADRRALRRGGRKRRRLRGRRRIAADFRGEVVQSDEVKLRELPATLQQMMLPMQVGQATQPFGSIDEGRSDSGDLRPRRGRATEPTFDEVYSQLNEERVNLRARGTCAICAVMR
jgi:peptidyl-prolyl cis-trans isomerase SurA